MRHVTSLGHRCSWAALSLGLILYPAVASADSGTEWGKRALRLQDQIDNAAPFVDTMWVGTHNSFNAKEWSSAYGFDPNQQETPLDQLRHGVRELVFDVHWYADGTSMLLCHGSCGGGEKSFRDGLDQIRNFLDEGNRDEVIMLKIEAEKGAVDNKFSKLANQLEGAIGARIFKPSNLGLANGCLGLNPAHLSKQKILDAGKNLIVITTPEKGCPSDGAFNEWIFSGFKFDDLTTSLKFEHPKDPTDCNSVEGSVGAQRMLRQLDDATAKNIADGPNGSVEIRDSNVNDYMKSGLNIFEMFNFNGTNAATTRPWLKPQDMVWSWRSGEPNNKDGNENCAVSGTDNRFNDLPCTETHAIACRNDAGVWNVTPGDGTFDQGEALCNQAFGATSHFSVPVNGRENQRFLAVKHSSTAVWLNYQDLSVEGQWIANSSRRLPYDTVTASGGGGGSAFDDAEEMKIDLYRTNPRRVSKVAFRDGARVDRVQLVYDDGTSVTHGGTGGSEHHITLAANEHVISYEVCVDEYSGSNRVFYLYLSTDQGQHISGGKKGNASCSSHFGYSGKHLFGFHGRSGENLDSLGFYFRAN